MNRSDCGNGLVGGDGGGVGDGEVGGSGGGRGGKGGGSGGCGKDGGGELATHSFHPEAVMLESDFHVICPSAVTSAGPSTPQ
eukprot:2421532-Pleurochrysis_carterae.AAC.1